MDAISTIQPGDALLYRGRGFFSWLIKIKSFHPVTHCEVNISSDYSVASRDGIGVSSYPVRYDGLYAILRPKPGTFKMYPAISWYLLSAKGQKYDWWGLLRFASLRSTTGPVQMKKQFCSEFLTRFYRAGGVDPFNGEDADAILPYQFLTSNSFDVIWRAQ